MTPNRHFNNTLSRVALDHVRATAGGDVAVAEVLRRAGDERPLSDLLDDQQWSSYDDFRRLLEAAAEALGGSKWLRDIAYVSELGGGSAPDATAMLRSFGSPDGLMAMVSETNFGICAIEQSSMEKVGRNEWLHRRRLDDGYEHFPEHCELSVAMTGIIPRLFGLPVVQLDKETCRLAGDEWCTTRVRWSDRPTAVSEADELRTTVDLLEGRMVTLQRSVAELVSPDELEVVLARVVRSAATAARAPGFLLALEPLPWSTQLVYSEGIDDERAALVAAALRDGALAGSHVLEVASARRHHGHLVATEFPLVEGQRVMLESYARLAASVLDSAIALEEARRQAATATVLLELSATLDELVTTEELAEKLAEAATIVTGADRSMVVLLDAATAQFRNAASHGYTAEDAGPLADFCFPAKEDLPQDIRYVQPAESTLSVILLPLGAVATVAVPVLIDGAVVGWIGIDVLEDASRLAPSAELEGRLLGLAGQAATALRNAGLVEQIRHQALHDALTGLPNRRMVLERLEQLAEWHQPAELAVLLVDLDDFKDVNDSLGHGAGDDLLRAVADRLSSVVRASDTIGRLGGDEFVVITRGGDPDELAGRLLVALARPFDVHGVSGRPVRVSASIGIASGACSSSDLLRDADVALYEAKRAGRNRSVRFHDSMQESLAQRLTLEDELREGITRGTFRLEYQPIVDLGCGRTVAVEALLRWESSAGPVPPCDFIPLLERSGLIEDVGLWVLTTACAQAAAWSAAGTPVPVTVNVSPMQLRTPTFVQDLAAAVAAAGINPSLLVLEVTETAAASDPAALTCLVGARALGVRVAVDDFGTGYSSLSHLREMPVDILKIDRSFVVGLGAGTSADAIMKTLLGLATSLGLAVIAEGVETEAQAAALRAHGCQTAQGFLFARPAPAEHVVLGAAGAVATA